MRFPVGMRGWLAHALLQEEAPMSKQKTKTSSPTSSKSLLDIAIEKAAKAPGEYNERHRWEMQIINKKSAVINNLRSLTTVLEDVDPEQAAYLSSIADVLEDMWTEGKYYYTFIHPEQYKALKELENAISG